MMVNNLSHITPQRAWAYLHLEEEMSKPEHDHVVQCERCLQLFYVCVKSEQLDTVLKEFAQDSSERRSAEPVAPPRRHIIRIIAAD